MNDSNSERSDSQRTDQSDSNARKGVSRRGFIQKLSALGLAGFGASAILAGCGGSDDSGSATSDTAASGNLQCDDLSGLTASERERRQTQVEALQYVEESETEGQYCDNCLFYQQPEEGSECGGCQLFPGPVNPKGWCNTWQAKAG
ncbi:high-potential iron-sulfur protein [Longibacter salinarum]|nr:high-potential iron-sulfur protein [Longibacter salinarum]